MANPQGAAHVTFVGAAGFTRRTSFCPVLLLIQHVTATSEIAEKQRLSCRNSGQEIAPFRLVPAGEFRYPKLLRSRADRESRTLASDFPTAFSLLSDGTGPVIPLDRRMRFFKQAPEIKSFHASDRGAAEPGSPCSRGITGRIPVLAKLRSGALRETDRQDFLRLDRT